MQSYDWSKVIQGLFEQWRNHPRSVNTPDSVGMYFRLQVECDNLGYEADGQTHHKEWERRVSKVLHFVITSHRPSVYLFQTDDYLLGLNEIDPAKWINTSNHGSCWRSDGLERHVTQAMFSVHDRAWNHVPKEHQPRCKSGQVRFTLATKWLSAQPFGFVQLKTEYTEDGYHKRVLSVKRLDTVILPVTPGSEEDHHD